MVDFPAVAVVDRIDFSNDSVSASPRGPLSAARYGMGAAGNSNYGWFGGGKIPGISIVETVDRIDFSNDTGTENIRSPLSAATYNLTATGNSNYGWFGGGRTFSPPLETVERIDFSNDLLATSPRGPLSLARYALAATSNSNYGWFGGGYGGPPLAVVAAVDRIDFSNDSVTASLRGSLNAPSGIFKHAATGNSNYGWFGGGQTSGPSVATVNRIDFSNDLATASVRGSLSAARYDPAATSNTPT